MSFLRRLFGFAAAHEPAGAPTATGDPERVRAVETVLAELRPLFRADGGDMVLLVPAVVNPETMYKDAWTRAVERTKMLAEDAEAAVAETEEDATEADA